MTRQPDRREGHIFKSREYKALAKRWRAQYPFCVKRAPYWGFRPAIMRDFGLMNFCRLPTPTCDEVRFADEVTAARFKKLFPEGKM